MKDELFQKILKEEVDKFLLIPISELITIEDYGSIIRNINEGQIKIGWWKYELSENIFHFVFKTSNRDFLILHKPFIDGFKIRNNKLERLSNIELGEYD